MDRKPGDWDCRSCQHLNFSRRDSCHRCGERKFGECGGFTARGASDIVRAGDWYCSAGGCGAHNFASRFICFKCGSSKDESTGDYEGGQQIGGGFGFGSARPGWKSGDWICVRSGCKEHNFASRMECHRCGALRDFSNQSYY